MNNRFKYLCVILAISIYGASAAEKSTRPSNVITLKDTIVGSKEQPRFISIVPWKKLTSPVISVNHVHKSQIDNLRGRSIESMKKQRELATHLLGRKQQ